MVIYIGLSIISAVIFAIVWIWLSDMMMDDWFEWLTIILICVVAASVPWVIKLAIDEQFAWEQFAKEHNCKIVGEMSPTVSVGPTVGSDGKVGFTTISSPGKTGWLCDNGITYWR